MTSNTKVFKVRFGHNGDETDEVRRITFQGVPTLDDLRGQCQRLFSLPANRVWYFKWIDEEGDSVTLTEETEFRDLLAARGDDVIRLILHQQEESSHPSVGAAWWVHPAAQHFLGRARRGHHQRQQPQPQPQESEDKPFYCGRCDQTNAFLRVGDGNWYHMPGSMIDLCKDAYDKLENAQKNAFVLVEKPEDLGEQMLRYQVQGRGERRHCGRRYHDGKPVGQVRGWCDVTRAPLHVGNGWYHRPGTTYDVCKAVHDSLPAEEKRHFVLVNSAEDLGAERVNYERRHCPAEARGCGQPQEQQKQQDAMTTLVDTLADMAADFIKVSVADGEDVMNGSTQPPHKSLEVSIVSGPSIAAGSIVKPGARLVPVWEVRNEGKDGVWTDVRVKPVGTNPFKAPENGFEVPLLAAGDSGLVSLELTVPAEATNGPVKASFALTDADGYSFGPALDIDVVVAAPAPEITAMEAEAVQQLLEMGFSDAAVCLRAVRDSKCDVNAAALALLRAIRK